MDEEVPLAADDEHPRGRQVGEIAALIGRERGDGERAGDRGEEAETGDARDGHILSDAVVVIAADAVKCVLADPLDAGAGLGPVVDQVADTYAGVERLPDRLQGRAVAVNVRDDKHPHPVLPLGF